MNANGNFNENQKIAPPIKLPPLQFSDGDDDSEDEGWKFASR